MYQTWLNIFHMNIYPIWKNIFLKGKYLAAADKFSNNLTAATK
jgi:hypothetical protein